MLTLPEHLMILPVFMGVHTASALFFVAFLFDSVCFVLVFLLFSFVKSLSCRVFGLVIFVDYPLHLLLRYSFADIFT